MNAWRPASAVRPPSQAGRFYAADSTELRGEVEGLLADVPPTDLASPKAVIAPHAGYVFSGPIAASAYAAFRPQADAVRRIILLGPSHHATFQGFAIPSCAAFSTPLGNIPLDLETLALMAQRSDVRELDSAHIPEHSLEVHVPFLQVVFAEFQLTPVLVGQASVAETSRLLDSLWNGHETRVIVSSDLSHFHDYRTAQALDAATAKQIEGLSGEELTGEDACGFRAIRGLLAIARRRGMTCRTLDLRNSGDTAGGRDRVVGYGAFALHEPGA